MNKKISTIITLLIFQILTNKVAQAKIKNISLEKAKNKIEKATKKLVNPSKKKEEETDKKEATKKALTKILVIKGNSKAIGLESIISKSVKRKIEKINSFITDQTKWTTKSELLKELKELFIKEKEEARKVLYHEILEAYANKKAPIIIFATDLKKEEEAIENFKIKLGKFVEKISKNDNLDKEINKLTIAIKKIDQLEENLDLIYKITDSILR